MPRFFVTREQIKDGFITITGDDAFHIARALRMAVGDCITVSDGLGIDYSAELTRIRDEECECKIISSSPAKTEMPVAVTLYMAYPKGDKLEVVVQKAVELGALRIVPFESKRCIKRPKAEKADKQTERLLKIAKEAAKQCGRGRLPEVSAPVSFSEMVRAASGAGLSLLCYEDEKGLSIKKVLEGAPCVKDIAVIVGCEGGFAPEEAEECKAAGILSVSLGERILRCETAPLFALSAILYRFDL